MQRVGVKLTHDILRSLYLDLTGLWSSAAILPKGPSMETDGRITFAEGPGARTYGRAHLAAILRYAV
jgi:hypothetical protein